MFADIGHFGRIPIQLALTFFVYPILVTSYLGQGAYLIEHPEAVRNPFFLSIPGGNNNSIFWIIFILATLSTIIASQALILGVFSIISQLTNQRLKYYMSPKSIMVKFIFQVLIGY